MKKSLIVLMAVCALLSAPISSVSAKEKQHVNNKIVIQNNYYEDVDYLIGNYPNTIKLVFSDIDGTIIPSDPTLPKNSITAEAKKAVANLNKAGIPFILVTGRSAREAKNIAQLLGETESYVIAQQGAVIMDESGSIVYEEGMTKGEVATILRDLKSFNRFYYTDVKPFIYVNGKMYAFKDIDLPYIKDKPIIISSLNDLGKDFICVKIGLMEKNEKTIIALQRYMEKHHGKKYNVMRSADCYCDISSATTTKGSAIKKLSEKLGYDLSNVAAFGDAQNDISMLRLLKNEGGLPIAVENASDITKAASSYITKSVKENGFSYGVEAILKNNKLLQP